MYEYVYKKEYAPVKRQLESILKETQVIMQKKYNLLFRFELIGSGKCHLITRKVGGNQGFDFDYNLIIPHPDRHTTADKIKQEFMEGLKTALKGTQYSFPKDSTSAITIKMVDKYNSKIKHSCDFAIIYYNSNDNCKGYHYLKKDKRSGKYGFAFRACSRNDINEKIEEILECDNGWNLIRDEYLKLKNINEDNPNKHSFSIYIEAVNNVYNQQCLQPTQPIITHIFQNTPFAIRRLENAQHTDKKVINYEKIDGYAVRFRF